MAAKKTSGSERQHQYLMKLKADPVLWQAHQLKERERWKQRQAAKQNQPKDVRTRRATRKKWREAQQKCREKKAEEKRRLQDVSTQPQMPILGIDSVPFSSAITCATERGRKRVLRDRCAAYLKIKQLKQQLEKEQRRAEKFKKRSFRATQSNAGLPTPEANVCALLKGGPQKKKSPARKALFLSSVICSTIRNTFERESCCRIKWHGLNV